MASIQQFKYQISDKRGDKIYVVAGDSIKEVQDELILLMGAPTPETTTASSDPTPKFGGTSYSCNDCGSRAEFKEGVSKKNGKPYKMIRCTVNSEHVRWID